MNAIWPANPGGEQLGQYWRRIIKGDGSRGWEVDTSKLKPIRIRARDADPDEIVRNVLTGLDSLSPEEGQRVEQALVSALDQRRRGRQRGAADDIQRRGEADMWRGNGDARKLRGLKALDSVERNSALDHLYAQLHGKNR